MSERSPVQRVVGEERGFCPRVVADVQDGVEGGLHRISNLVVHDTIYLGIFISPL